MPSLSTLAVASGLVSGAFSSAVKNAVYRRQSTSWTLSTTYEGSTFFDAWDFISGADTGTAGQVTYQAASEAASLKLAYVNSAGQAIMKVDNTTTLASGADRNSVRISSTEAYNSGSLIIIDAEHVPYGCSVWPAFWMFGPDWPEGGEIDIFEGVNLNTVNQMTLHTEPGCEHDPSAVETGVFLDEDCDTAVNGNAGCGVQDTRTASFGAPFAAAGGGVWATEWLDTGIAVWFFERADIPSDITSGSPDPSGWGTPVAYWPSTTCDITEFFYDQNIIFDITFCGDWAGATDVWDVSGCQTTWSTCSAVVETPSNFNNAYFAVNYVKVWTSATGSTTTTAATTTTTSKGTQTTTTTAGTSTSTSTDYEGQTCNGAGYSASAAPVYSDCEALWNEIYSYSGTFTVAADTAFGYTYGTCAIQFCNWGSEAIVYDYNELASVASGIVNFIADDGDDLAQCVFVEGDGAQYIQVQSSTATPDGANYSLSGRTYC